MGMIRGVLITTVSILLFLGLFAMSSFMTMSLSLEYEVLQPELTSAVRDIVTNQINLSDIDEQTLPMATYCQNYSNYTFEQAQGMYNYTIPCDLVMQGSEVILDNIIQTSVDEQYYKEYTDCKFWDCGIENPLFLYSNRARIYWNEWFYKSLIFSIILALLLLLVMEKRSNWPFLMGILLIISGLIFFGIGWIISLVEGSKYIRVFTLFFTKIHLAFLYSFIIGIIFIGIGLVLKFLNIGSKISGLFPESGKKQTKSSKSSK